MMMRVGGRLFEGGDVYQVRLSNGLAGCVG